MNWSDGNGLAPENYLKVCPICDSLNLASASKCAKCNWNGTFVNDNRLIRERLDTLYADSECAALEPTLSPRIVVELEGP